MDEHVYKSHSKTLLMYHLVFPAGYRRKVFTSEVKASLEEICLGIEARHELRCIEIGVAEETMGGIPTMAVNEIVRIIMSAVGQWVSCSHRRIVCGERDHQKVWRESREAGRIYGAVFQLRRT